MRHQDSRPLVTFLTDFGLAWGPVGVCHAVMRDIAPGIEIVDLSHGIPPFQIRAGAWVLASALPYTAVATHVAVVDPGVGTSRFPLVLRCERGDALVGPDNGLLVPAAERLGGVVEARHITNPDLMRHPVSATFHGRDIFAPVGAHLASGLPLGEVGPQIDPALLAPPPWQRPRYGEGHVVGEVALLDSFDNVRTNIEVERWPVAPGNHLRARTSGGEAEVATAHTFGEVGQGTLFAFEDSSGYACLAMNLGNAGAALGIRPGDSLELQRL
ncbi:MAG: SAM-dependent chlorinase/fluorinase [Chloroflexota bacterium]|nr:SAM-dependent chlorinase/fluorinase [Chloroflexota bacterium]